MAGDFPAAGAARLLIEEKVAIQGGQLSKLGSVNPTVDRLRRELFGEKMSHSGLCGALFDRLDRMLLDLLRHSRIAAGDNRFESGHGNRRPRNPSPPFYLPERPESMRSARSSESR